VSIEDGSRSAAGAVESLVMLEEAPQEFMLQVEEGQRDTRSDSVGDDRPGR
jgi:hypothetical protein